ncbi:glycosyl transferase family 1 [Sesbania bispinosa]|nr:glycosyl transferase family 1 [Sesbania bispinosa]
MEVERIHLYFELDMQLQCLVFSKTSSTSGRWMSLYRFHTSVVPPLQREIGASSSRACRRGDRFLS